MHVSLSDYEHASVENHTAVKPKPAMLYKDWSTCLNASVSDIYYSHALFKSLDS